MSKDVLGPVTVREIQGVFTDLLEKLGAPDGREWFRASKRFLRKEEPWPVAEGVIAPDFSRDMSAEGWALLQDTSISGAISIADLELVPFLGLGEPAISSPEMVRRAKRKHAALGQRHAEYLLAHQGEIPEGWRIHYLVFPGTIWRGRDGNRNVPYLNWDGEWWILGFNWLGRWYSNDRLVRPSK